MAEQFSVMHNKQPNTVYINSIHYRVNLINMSLLRAIFILLVYKLKSLIFNKIIVLYRFLCQVAQQVTQ
ncbi:hypothetical protein PA25_17510 [Pseudoalteromonas sp. A25]|nr:hypothetical protein PA25_17510 [Pseudoalteromonas sp. A25]